MRCLACVLEFPTWELAKPWSYISGYAFAEGLEELGHDVDVNVLMHGWSGEEMVRSLTRLQQSDRPYDLAFFWLPHLEYTSGFWDVAASLAEHRVGVVIESLGYTASEKRRLRHLRGRRREVLRSLHRCSHVVTFDYADYRYLEDRGHSVFWTPGLVPSVPDDVFGPFSSKAPKLAVAGTLYGRRRKLHRNLLRAALVDESQKPVHTSAWVDLFDEKAEELLDKNAAGAMGAQEHIDLSAQIMRVRREIWLEYLGHLRGYAGVISLPAFFKGFPGRVFEGILADCVPIVCNKRHLTRQMRAFEGIDVIYLGESISPRELSNIEEIIRDPARCLEITSGGRELLLQNFGSAVVLSRLLDWVRLATPRSRLAARTASVLPYLRRRARFYDEPHYEAA